MARIEASILIVSKNRKAELAKTLEILKKYVQLDFHEVLVFLDGCTDSSEKLIDEFPWVQWYSSKQSLGASRARRVIFEKASGETLIGFDDDAHPLQENFVAIAQQYFFKNEKLGILAFKEIKGIFSSDETIPSHYTTNSPDLLVNNFIGCGFAIHKHVYDKTRGFPAWVDIYGEEDCLSLEVLDLGYDIVYTNKLMVNHRVDREQRKLSGANTFRFEKQLKNTTFFYLVFFPFPMFIIKTGKLYFHNFKKYGCLNFQFFKAFMIAGLRSITALPEVLKFRKPVSKETLQKYNSLAKPQY